MGRSESGTSAGAIAVIVIAGILLLLLLGCGGLAAMSFLFMARSPGPIMSSPMSDSSTPAMPADNSIILAPIDERVITNDAAGQAIVDGEIYSDEALRELLQGDAAAGGRAVRLELTPELAADRRAAIVEILVAAETTYSAPDDSFEPIAPTE